MKRVYLLRMLTLSTTFISIVLFGQTKFASPTREIYLAQHFVDRPIPLWQNGHFLTFDDATQVQYPNVYLYDSVGGLERQIKVIIPEAVRNDIAAVSISGKGTVAVSGGALNSVGHEAAYIAFFTKAGTLDRVVRTNPFVAYHLCFTSDGQLWALGREQRQYGGNEQSHNLLQRYTGTGTLSSSLLPLESFPKSEMGRHPAVQAFLACGPDRVGVYSESARQWIEVGVAGKVLGRWDGISTPAASELRVRGLGLTPSGLVFVSAVIKDDSKASHIETYTLNRTTRAWDKVDTADLGSEGKAPAIIAGNDGEYLVVSRRWPAYAWVRPR